MKLKDIILEVNSPNVLYHATYKPLLKKIAKHGLDSTKGRRWWDDSKVGVIYLAFDKNVAASYAESSDTVPESYLDQIVILTIDAAKLDRSKLKRDANVNNDDGDTLEYHGVIPYDYITHIERYE